MCKDTWWTFSILPQKVPCSTFFHKVIHTWQEWGWKHKDGKGLTCQDLKKYPHYNRCFPIQTVNLHFINSLNRKPPTKTVQTVSVTTIILKAYGLNKVCEVHLYCTKYVKGKRHFLQQIWFPCKFVLHSSMLIFLMFPTTACWYSWCSPPQQLKFKWMNNLQCKFQTDIFYSGNLQLQNLSH